MQQATVQFPTIIKKIKYTFLKDQYTLVPNASTLQVTVQIGQKNTIKEQK